LPKLMLFLPFYFLQRRYLSYPVCLAPNVRGADHTLYVSYPGRAL
jgi:hypothetical protein